MHITKATVYDSNYMTPRKRETIETVKRSVAARGSRGRDERVAYRVFLGQ